MVDDLLRLVLGHLTERSSFPIIVTGSIGAGKTELSRQVVEAAKKRGYEVGGVLSPRLMDAGETVGYDVIDLMTGERRSFLRIEPPGEKLGKFFLKPGSLEFSNRAISNSLGKTDLVLVDEVGRLEIRGKGLTPSISELLDSDTQGLFLVRGEFLSTVTECFGIDNYDLVEL